MGREEEQITFQSGDELKQMSQNWVERVLNDKIQTTMNQSLFNAKYISSSIPLQGYKRVPRFPMISCYKTDISLTLLGWGIEVLMRFLLLKGDRSSNSCTNRWAVFPEGHGLALAYQSIMTSACRQTLVCWFYTTIYIFVEFIHFDLFNCHNSWVVLFHQSCSISMFPYRFNINYSVCLLINTNININYFKEGLSISILYQLLKKLPYQFQYQYILSISPYDIVKITNFLSISQCYQYQCWYQLSK